MDILGGHSAGHVYSWLLLSALFPAEGSLGVNCTVTQSNDSGLTVPNRALVKLPLCQGANLHPGNKGLTSPCFHSGLLL